MRFFTIEGKDLNDKQKEDIRELLFAADEEFVPPLSSRSGTTQTDLSPDGGRSASGPEMYLNTMLGQSFILAQKDGKVCGFMSYIPSRAVDLDEDHYLIGEYVSTVIVAKKARGRHLCERMYRVLFENSPTGYVLTRTWSQNHAHLAILKKLGFTCVYTIRDDRGPGVDTVYYAIDLTQETESDE